MDSWFQDLRFSVRSFAKRPTFTVLAVLTLALGIGMTSSIFSLVHAVLLEPLPIKDAGRVVLIDRTAPSGFVISVSIPTYQDWHEHQRTFEHLGAFRFASANLTGQGEAERLVAIQVTSDFFRALGVEPVKGRAFGSDADDRGAPREVVLSERFWEARLGRRDDVVGEVLNLGGEPFTVVGVMPAELGFLSRQTQLFLPLGAFAERLPWDERGSSPGLYALGRVADGVSDARLREDLDAMTAAIAAASGEEEPVPRLRPLAEVIVGDVRAPLLILLGAVAFVLTIACANVANLLLARGESRAREIATRRAVGAGRGRVVRQLMTESLVLASGGGLLGLFFAHWALQGLVAWLPDNLPLVERVAIDGSVVAWMFGVTLLTGLAFGAVPALLTSRTDLISDLRDGNRQAGSRHPLLQGLVVFELAVAVVLLIGAGLLFRSLEELRTIDPGFRAAGVQTMRLDLPAASYDEARWTAFYDQLLEKAAALPGAQSVAVNSLIPLWSGGAEGSVLPEGVELKPENSESVLFQSASAEYFETLGIPLLQGRTFQASDTDDAPHVAIVDKTLAQTFWPGQSALGRRLAFEFDLSTEPPTPIWREVVGVVGHVRHYDLRTPSRVELYVPYRQLPLWSRTDRPTMALFARAAGDADPASLVAPLRGVVAEIDPNLPVANVQTLEDVLSRVTANDRLLTRLLGVFSAAALVLAAIGIYGVMAWMVGERTREIGLRMALGADGNSVLNLVLRRGLALAGLGIAVGGAVAFGLARLLGSVLYGVTAADPKTYLTVPCVLLLSALAACLLPALRASRTDPLVALRYE